MTEKDYEEMLGELKADIETCLPICGGEGIVTTPQAEFNVRFKNTSSEQEFVIDSEGLNA